MTSAVSPRSPFLDLLREIKTPVDATLELTLNDEVRAFGVLGEEVQWMLESARVLCRGGKRLRAGLIAAGYEAVSGRPSVAHPPVIGAGVAVELLQSYFLVHDDWMDQDATRRGNPTVHTDLARRFDDSHLGACGAVLAGDFLVGLAHREFHRVALTQTNAAPLLSEFTQMQLAAVAGQQLDVIGRTRNALSVYELKTGSYTVSGPLCLGALLGGAPTSALPAITKFAMPAGIAFQLRDDLLNLFAAPDQTGKPQGSDITAGKWTWTAQWVKQHAAASQLRVFDAAFGARDASSADLGAALAAVNDCGALAATEAFIQAREQECLTALWVLADELRLSRHGVELLQSAVTALLHRSS
jgi:geranylgeranyl diphosphate synthase, type I